MISSQTLFGEGSACEDHTWVDRRQPLITGCRSLIGTDGLEGAVLGGNDATQGGLRGFALVLAHGKSLRSVTLVRMAKAPGTPMRQHTVSKFLLKRFADQGDVAVFDRRDGRRRRLPFGSGILETKFDAHDPKGSGAMWGSVETRAGINIMRLEWGLPLKSDDEQTLRDLMAVHWARSRAIMIARDAITEGIVEDSKRKILEARPHLLVQAYLAEVGLLVPLILTGRHDAPMY